MSMNCRPDSSCKRTGPCKPILLRHRQPPQVSYRPKDRNNSPKLYRHSCSVTGDVYDKVEVLAAISRSRSERSHVRLAARKCSDCHVFRTRSGSGRADVRLATDLFQKSFSDPSEAVPAVEEDEAADVLVEGEDGPHGDETPSEGDA